MSEYTPNFAIAQARLRRMLEDVGTANATELEHMTIEGLATQIFDSSSPEQANELIAIALLHIDAIQQAEAMLDMRKTDLRMIIEALLEKIGGAYTSSFADVKMSKGITTVSYKTADIDDFAREALARGDAHTSWALGQLRTVKTGDPRMTIRFHKERTK